MYFDRSRIFDHFSILDRRAFRYGAKNRFGNYAKRAEGISNDRAHSERIAKPAQRKSGGLGDAHHVPASGNGVAKRMEPAARIERRAIGCSEDHAGSSDGRADYTCANDAHSDSSGGLVASTGNNRRAYFQAGRRRTLDVKLAADLW